MTNLAHYSLLADLLEFPSAEYFSRVTHAPGVLRERFPLAASEIETFLAGIPKNMDALQELHTRTFDVQAITTLDIGYVLFGDDYKRGELLSNLNREHREVGNDLKGELSDHLPNILRLIAKSGKANSEMLNELVREIMVPTLMLMIGEFDPSRVEKKNEAYQKHFKTVIDSVGEVDSLIYCRPLRALLEVIKQDFSVADQITMLSDLSSRPQTADFLKSIHKEIEIEKNCGPRPFAAACPGEGVI